MTTIEGKNCIIKLGNEEIKGVRDWKLETGDIVLNADTHKMSVVDSNGQIVEIIADDLEFVPSVTPSEPVRYSFEAAIKEVDLARGKIRDFFKGGDDMGFVPPRVTVKLLRHTRMRFDTLTIRQLWTRMGKITNPEKLIAFAQIASERGRMDLSIAARARYADITGDNSMLSGLLGKPKPKKNKKTDRLLRKLDV